MKKNMLENIAFWTVTILGPASFVWGGVLLMTQSPEAVKGLVHLGYPLYFAQILGLWKLLGAIAVVMPGMPRVKEWAYAGFCFDLTAAAASHAFVGDPAVEIVLPLVFLGLVAASWALRPASRRVQDAAAAAATRGTLVAAA